MKLLLILLVHPSHVIKARNHVPLVLVHFAAATYVVVCGLAFQHLYPRLLNKIPWLGAFRRLSPANWNPRFDPELFLRGTAMGMVVLVVFWLGYVLLGQLTPGRGKSFEKCYLAALATTMPHLLSCLCGFLLYHMHNLLGLLPVYGLIAATCLQVMLLRDLFGVHRGFIIYLAPSLLSMQAAACYLLMP